MVHKRVRGFTVFELVFIALIVGVQLAVLLPVLEAAKERDRATTCQNNLHQCAQALKIYIDDYEGTLPSSAIVASSPNQAQVISFLTGKGEPFPKPYGTSGPTWPQILEDWMRTTDIVFCPSDRARTRASYWWKYAIDLAWRDNTIHARKTGDYGYESDQIVFYEHAGWHTGDAAGIKNGVKINVAHLDSHVETITVVNGPTAYPPAADERTGAAGIRLGEPMYYNCKVDGANPPIIHSPADFIDPRYCYDQF